MKKTGRESSVIRKKKYGNDKKKIICIGLFTLMATIVLSGCSGSSEPIVGYWQSTTGNFYIDYQSEHGYEKLLVDVLQISPDGTIRVYTPEGRVEIGTWESTEVELYEITYHLTLKMQISGAYYSPYSAQYLQYTYTYEMSDRDTLKIEHGLGQSTTFRRS